MSIPKNILEKYYEPLDKWVILMGYRGSIAHDMYVPQSNPDCIDDKDVMAICVPDIDYYFGLKKFGSRDTMEIKEAEWDIVVYEARKFIELLKKGNPNVLSLLWLKPEHYLKISEAGKLLIDNRDLFIGRHIYKPFIGYAQGQLHRMTHLAFEGYMGAKRKELVRRFGYDTKNAAHLIRLLRMGIEVMRDGEINVSRYDRQQLLEIKRGEWTLEQVQSESKRLFELSESVFLSSTLPKEADSEKINKICVEVVRLTHESRHE